MEPRTPGSVVGTLKQDLCLGKGQKTQTGTGVLAV